MSDECGCGNGKYLMGTYKPVIGLHRVLCVYHAMLARTAWIRVSNNTLDFDIHHSNCEGFGNNGNYFRAKLKGG